MSNKKLLSHLERCEKRSQSEYINKNDRNDRTRGYSSSTQNLQSYRKFKSSKSIDRSSKSDGEHSERRSLNDAKYIRVIEKLQSERRSLKDRLMKVDIDHTDDMTNRESYYNNKISNIEYKNNKLQDTKKENFNIEILKLRKQFTRKIEKIKIENNNVDQITELEKTIQSLKEKEAANMISQEKKLKSTIK